MLATQERVSGEAALSFQPARKGVLSWNTLTPAGTLELRLRKGSDALTPWLPYAQWSRDERRSCSPQHAGVSIDVDVIRSERLFDAIDIRAAGVAFSAIGFATPPQHDASLPYAAAARVLDVPARSQYAVAAQRGWCSPASLSMVNAYHGLDYGVAETARAVFDSAYNGTGNWAFNVAFSGSLGLRAAVVFLRNLDHAQRLIEAGLPIVLSYSWTGGELPGAPLEHSDGHLAVLRGFTENGDCAMNDPAAPALSVVYPRASIEKIWQRNDGAAYVVAPGGKDFVSIVNS